MYEEALHTYNLLVKNKQYPQSGRLRVNMGNIHYEQKKYPMAIKVPPPPFPLPACLPMGSL